MISELVSILSEDESVAFVKYLRSRNRRSEARNVELFQAILSGRESELKAELGSNAYNVLRSRLKERLIDFIAASTIQKEGSAANELSKTFITGKRLLIQGKTNSAFKLLEKVELQAHALENYILEGEVQQLLIEYAHVQGAPALDKLYARSRANFELQHSRTKLNMAYARIRLAYQEVEFGGGQLDLTEILHKTFDEFAISDEIAFGFSSLHQLIQLYDIYGAYSKNYHQINLFFVDKLKMLQGSSSDIELNSHYHIEILYAIANIYFRKKDFTSSLTFLEQMKSQLDRFSHKQSRAYRLKHGMLSALNHNHIGEPEKAREFIDEALRLQLRSNDTIQIRLALAMIQFQQGELRDCQRTLAKFSHTDSWYEMNLGIEWTLHKLTIEVLLHIDLENYDYAESRIKSLLRKYKAFLHGEGKDQALPFLRLVQMILREPTIVKTDKFHEQVENSIQWKRAEEEDVFRVNFYAWLKAKMTGKQVYPTLLELLNFNNLESHQG